MMSFFELDAAAISALNDSDLRELVARLCEAEVAKQGIPVDCVRWGGAQETIDGGVDVKVDTAHGVSEMSFIPRQNTIFQIKKHTMPKAACKKEMQKVGEPKAILLDLAFQKGAYIIVSGFDNCSEAMLSERIKGMQEATIALQNKDDLYLDFYGRDRLSSWLRLHPSVALWVRYRLGVSLAGWKPFGRWAATPIGLDDEFLSDDHLCFIDMQSHSKETKTIKEGIHLVRSRLRSPKSIVRIIGLSGVGKTRFAQALFEPNVGIEALPASDVIYADIGNGLTPTASELVTYLIHNNFATYLVLDNCPADLHQKLQKQVAESHANLRLLTIEYDISDDKPEATEVVHLEPASEKLVSLLTQKRFPHLGHVNSDLIAKFAGGNARIALALASRVESDETLSNFSNEELFQRLFSQRKESSQELMKSAEVLALVYSYNISRSELNDELSVLGAIAGLTRQALYRDQAEILRRQLAQQRGNWRAILPHALANRLAKRALENISLDEINAELFKPNNVRLFISCAHRLGFLHDSDQARELGLSWVQPGAPLENIAVCNTQYLSVLNYIAPIFPEVVLSSMERASNEPEFASRTNERFPELVRLLCHLAYDDDTFNRALSLLLKFAESEKDGENNNSIVRMMQHLFSLHLSGTMATPKRRQLFIQKLLSSNSSRHLRIAELLLSSAFEAQHWSSCGSFQFGARKRSQGWFPSNNEERIAWYIGFVQLLEPFLNSVQQTQKDWSKKILAKHFRSLWSFAGCWDLLEQIIYENVRADSWAEMWIAIKQTIHFDGEKLAPEILDRLESLKSLTEPSDLLSEIDGYVLADEWDHTELNNNDFQQRHNEIYDRAARLGEVVSTQLECLDRLGAKLWTTHSQPLWYFGKGIATGSTDKLLTSELLTLSFRKHLTEPISLVFYSGFIRGVHDLDPQQARQILERALEVPEFITYAVSLLTMVPIAPWSSQKLLELAHKGVLEAWRFEQLGHGLAHVVMPDDELSLLLTEINLLDKGWFSTVKILSMRFFRKEERGYSPSNELLATARTAIRGLVSTDRSGFGRAQLNGLGRVLDAALTPSAPKCEVKEIISVFIEGIETFRLYSFEMTDVTASLIKTFPELFLDTIFSNKNGEELAMMLFMEESSRKEPALNDISLNRFLAWCGNDQDRIKKVAQAVRPYCFNGSKDELSADPKRMTLSEHIKSLLAISDDKLSIVNMIFESTQPRSYSGSLADLIESRSTAFAELLQYPDLEVQTLAQIKMDRFEQIIRRAREYETTEHIQREQRFE